MCGLVGAFRFEGSSRRISGELITRMRDTMIHRGPDGCGVWVSPDGRIGLGHRRLAIIDLSEEAGQPMSNPDGSLQIVFNGEIYNHREIRTELERLGTDGWMTDHSDTEVVLRAFERWGIGCLERFRGMFALAVWDERVRELWLARDRIGIKPLYYSLHVGGVSFASEIKALLADPGQKREVCEEALFDYLSFLTTPAPQTLFAGIKKLPAATWMKIDRHGAIRQQQYWNVYDHTKRLEGASDEELAERILDGLRTAVGYRKVSDVPVGVFLSGGVDSATNAALFSSGGREPLSTFTIGYDEQCRSNPTETPYARRVAEAFAADHREHLLTEEDLLAFLPEMIRLQDEPIADPVCVPVYYVSKLARDSGVIVCQVGEGSDELFGGYPGWLRTLQIQTATSAPGGRQLSRLGAAGLGLAGRSGGWPAEKLRRAALGQPVFWGGAEAFTQQQKQRLLSPRLRRKFAGRTSWSTLEPVYHEFQERSIDRHPLDWMTYLDLNLRLPELLLMRVDKMSMGVSLEARVPFLDHEFVALAMSIPAEKKIQGGDPKHIFKQSVRGLIPNAIIDRKKQGFGVPVYEWFYGNLGRIIRRELEEFCDQTDFFDRKEVLRVVGAGGQAPWYLLNFALWWKTYIAGKRMSEDWSSAAPRAA